MSNKGKKPTESRPTTGTITPREAAKIVEEHNRGQSRGDGLRKVDLGNTRGKPTTGSGTKRGIEDK